jgi:DNA modification methylase
MTIICGDCLEVMKTFPDNHFSCVCTDPPYGISFMGKDWDHGLPSQEYWKEMLRIVKPGSHLLAAGLPRTIHRLICTIEDSGWIIRDLFMHIFGSGFPKSHNYFGINGYGTALKPAWEGWSLAMKPCDGTFAQNAEKWGQAGINIDGCRILTDELKNYSPGLHRGSLNDDGWKGRDQLKKAPKGRWPANVIFDEEAARMLDEQTKEMRASKPSKTGTAYKASGAFPIRNDIPISHNDSGGASRFFYCAKASPSERNEGLEDLPLIRSGCERMNNSDGRKEEIGESNRMTLTKNHHPTVKPLKLMEYLIKLIMPPQNGILLDPFAGSGTTILAAKRLGFEAIGIEKQEEYCEIARKRLEHFDEQKPEEQLKLKLS